MKSKKRVVVKMTLSSMFLCLGWILPFLTGQIPQIGNMLCPMHIPAILCGMILGPIYGLIIGALIPITRTLLFGMPIFYPISICMAFELATYGFVAGLLFHILFKKQVNIQVAVFVSLVSSMLTGRIIWGIARYVCGVFSQNAFTIKLFLAGGFINAWPGMIVQIVLIPILMNVLYRTHYLEKYID